jgi:AMMECR1 domain-containing protein
MTRTAAIAFALALLAFPVSAADSLDEWRAFTRTDAAAKLLAWMKGSMNDILEGKSLSPCPVVTPAFYGRNGIFVTLVRGGRTRGCFGAFHHSSDDAGTVFAGYLRSALRSDPRYAPLEPYEAADTAVIITVADQPSGIDDIFSVDLSRFGVLVTTDSEEKFAFVPCEVKTADYLRRLLKGRRITETAAFSAVSIR